MLHIADFDCHVADLTSQLIEKTLDWSRKWLVNMSARKTQLVLFDWSNKMGAVDLKTDGSVLEEKPLFKWCG